ncbi:MAG: hypothetical protein PHY80_03470 [Rickettsiales bacterium]|nr:hypothetical protein [Rickettsiales bacterium]
MVWKQSKIMIKKLFLMFLILFLGSNSFADVNPTYDNKNVEHIPTNVTLTPQSKTSTNYYQIFKSIMFSTNDVEEISKTLPRFKYLNEFKQEDNNIKTSQFSKQSSDIKQKSIFNFGEGSIYIYLNSIMYVSQNDWSVWISGNKITNLTNDSGEIKVLDIFPSLVRLAWTFDLNQWEVINPNKLIPESNYIIKDNTVTLIFSLSPNQSFLPTMNQTIEGKIKEVKTNSMDNTSDQSTNVNNDKQKSKQSTLFDDLFF